MAYLSEMFKWYYYHLLKYCYISDLEKCLLALISWASDPWIISDYSDNSKPTLEIGGGVWAVVDVIISGGQRSERNKDIQFLLKSVEKQCHLKKKL